MTERHPDETSARGFRRIWIDHTADVAVSQSELYTLLSDLDNWPSWTPGLKAIRRKRETPLTPGARFMMVLEAQGLPFDLYLPCQLFISEPGWIEWGGGAVGSAIRHRFELTPLAPNKTRLRHVEYATNLLALITLPGERMAYAHDKRWSDAIVARFASATSPA
jgi:hypothetical protein